MFKSFLHVETKESNLICTALSDISSDIFNSQKKTMKMMFFSEKIQCISSRNVLNITNMQNPKWLHVHERKPTKFSLPNSFKLQLNIWEKIYITTKSTGPFTVQFHVRLISVTVSTITITFPTDAVTLRLFV